MATYNLRKKNDVCYQDWPILPRARRVNDKLYPIEVVEEKEDRVKIHFTGYDTKYDEWRSKTDIVKPTKKPKRDDSMVYSNTYRPFNLHDELRYQIKLALDSKRRKLESK